MESNPKSGILGLFRYFWQNKSRKTAFLEPCSMVNHMAMKNFRLCVRSLKIRGIYQQQVKDIPQTKFQTGFIIAWPGKSLISTYLPTSLLLALSLKYLQFNATVYCLKNKILPKHCCVIYILRWRAIVCHLGIQNHRPGLQMFKQN